MSTSVFLLFGLVWLGLGIWVLVDANSHPDWAWQRAGQNKMVWMIVPVVAALFCGIVTLVMAIIYFTSIKNQVVAAEAGGGGGGGYGGGGPYG
jgi:hypothetical protein